MILRKEHFPSMVIGQVKEKMKRLMGASKNLTEIIA